MPNPHDSAQQAIEKHFPGGFSLRDEANAIVALAFRNGPIEDLHAGESSPLLDNPDLSRITNAEMKTIMLHACRMVEELLKKKEENTGGYYLDLMEYGRQYCREWER
ncbi:MAG: hypothetical protein WD768_06600 [Phycisphaeraceae bacterium]